MFSLRNKKNISDIACSLFYFDPRLLMTELICLFTIHLSDAACIVSSGVGHPDSCYPRAHRVHTTAGRLTGLL